MKISFLVNEVFDGWEPQDVRLGGTEESVVRWTQELTKEGRHDVTVYRNGRGFGADSGPVVYREREEYRDNGGVTINIKSSEVAPKEPTLYLTNETDADKLNLSMFKGVIWPSLWAAEHISVNNDNTYILPHGYDPDAIYPSEKVPKQCFYASSPDRGLENMLDAWPEVHRAHPDATLITTYGGFIDLPGVINMGEVDELTMNEIYQTSDIWCHPCSGGELYCMTGKKAQVAGCIPVIIPTMALAETVERGFKTNRANYAKTVVEVLNMTPNQRDTIRGDVIKHANASTWKESTKQLLKIIQSAIM